MTQRDNELKNTTYEIFIGLLSILSIINIALFFGIQDVDVRMVISIMDTLLTVIFLADFFFRLFTADSKMNYLLRQYGWADLLSCMPGPRLKLLRLFRVFRVSRLLHEFGPAGVFTEFLGNRAKSALLSLLFFVILLLEFGGMAILAVEQNVPNASITTGSDAVWYTFVTITTVGYGDTYPVSHKGRLIGLLIMAVGVGLFGTLTGFLSSFFLGESSAADMIALDPVTDSNTMTVVAAGTDDGAHGELPPNEASHIEDEAKAKVAELKRMLAQQAESQAALERKIEEIESLL